MAVAVVANAPILLPLGLSAPAILRDQQTSQSADGLLPRKREFNDLPILLDETPRFLVVRHLAQKGDKCKNASVLAGILRQAPRLRNLVLDGCILRKADVSQLVAAMISHSVALNPVGRASRVSREDHVVQYTTDASFSDPPDPLLTKKGSIHSLLSRRGETSQSHHSILADHLLTDSSTAKVPAGNVADIAPEPGPVRSGTLFGIHALSLSDCYLSAQAIEPLAQYLAHPQCTIRKLNLSRNMLGPDGAHILASALRVNRSLRELDLTWNDLGMTGCRSILDCLPYEANRAIAVQLHCNKVDTSLQRPRGSHSDSRGLTGLRMAPALHSWSLPSISDCGLAEITESRTEDMSRTLYEIVGGESVIKDIVDTFYLLLVTDSMIGPKFFTTLP
jgi:hypothetical protein